MLVVLVFKTFGLKDSDVPTFGLPQFTVLVQDDVLATARLGTPCI